MTPDEDSVLHLNLQGLEHSHEPIIGSVESFLQDHMEVAMLQCQLPYSAHHETIEPTQTAVIHQLTFFIVEDDTSILDLLCILLHEERSCKVISATSPQQALEIAHTLNTPPSMMLLDYMLGSSIHGIELYDTFCEHLGWKDIPTIMMSAALPQEAVDKRKLIGIHKPFDIYRLLDIIDVVLGKESIVD